MLYLLPFASLPWRLFRGRNLLRLIPGTHIKISIILVDGMKAIIVIIGGLGSEMTIGDS